MYSFWNLRETIILANHVVFFFWIITLLIFTFSGTLLKTKVFTMGETINFCDIWEKLALGSNRFDGPRNKICRTILSHPASKTKLIQYIYHGCPIVAVAIWTILTQNSVQLDWLRRLNLFDGSSGCQLLVHWEHLFLY